MGEGGVVPSGLRDRLVGALLEGVVMCHRWFGFPWITGRTGVVSVFLNRVVTTLVLALMHGLTDRTAAFFLSFFEII